MQRNRAHLVKKTIVNKNGITTTVWVRAIPKKKEDKKKKPLKKEEKLPLDVRNYKTQSTEELIQEATGLGLEWKVNQDSRINRMRVIMALKEYYSSNNQRIIQSPKEPEFWKNEIEAAKYQNIELTDKTKKVARQTGILAEDEQSMKYIRKTISEKTDSYFSDIQEVMSISPDKFGTSSKAIGFMMESLKTFGRKK